MIRKRNEKSTAVYPFIDPSYMRLENVEVEKNGTLVQTSKIVLYDPREEFKDVKLRDFSLENLIKLDSPLLKQEFQMESDNIDKINKAFENVQVQESQAS